MHIGKMDIFRIDETGHEMSQVFWSNFCNTVQVARAGWDR